MSGDDKGNQQTKVGEMRELIDNIRSLSVDLRDKAFQLTPSPRPPDDAKKEITPTADTVGAELVQSLREIRGTLRLAFDTFSAYN